jgi:large subunit ribosomal protein L18
MTKPRTVSYRRKSEEKTDYKKRLSLLVSGKLRLVVRFSNSKIIAQLVEFQEKGDKVLVGVDSSSLKKEGWNYSMKNFPAAYLTGLKLGTKAVEKGCKEALLDTGFRAPIKKGKIYSFLKGVLDSGLKVPHGEEEEIFPSAERISGKIIGDYAEKAKSGQAKGTGSYDKLFSGYIKNKVQPEKMAEEFEKIRKKLGVKVGSKK